MFRFVACLLLLAGCGPSFEVGRRPAGPDRYIVEVRGKRATAGDVLARFDEEARALCPGGLYDVVTESSGSDVMVARNQNTGQAVYGNSPYYSAIIQCRGATP